MSTSLISWLKRVARTPVSTFDRNDIGALWLLANYLCEYIQTLTSCKSVAR
jgi:hypothetical protein